MWLKGRLTYSEHGWGLAGSCTSMIVAVALSSERQVATCVMTSRWLVLDQLPVAWVEQMLSNDETEWPGTIKQAGYRHEVLRDISRVKSRRLKQLLLQTAWASDPSRGGTNKTWAGLTASRTRRMRETVHAEEASTYARSFYWAEWWRTYGTSHPKRTVNHHLQRLLHDGKRKRAQDRHEGPRHREGQKQLYAQRPLQI